MKTEPVIAVVGATGLIGNEIVVVLDQEKLPYSEIRLFASADSAGEIYRVNEEEVEIETLEEGSFKDIDLAVFATRSDLSAKFIPLALQAGAKVIDLSSCSRSEPTVPLIVSGVNDSSLSPQTIRVACPDSGVVELASVLAPIREVVGVKRVVATMFYSVSGAGKEALDELWSQALAIFNQKEVVTEAFQHQIAFNLIPQVDVVTDDGSTKAERDFAQELRKIFGAPELPICVTAVRVPVLYGYSASINIETERALTPGQCSELLTSRPGLVVYPDWSDYPMPLTVAGSDDIHVGRIRRDSSVANGLSMWVVCDNVRAGAATNAVKIARSMMAPDKVTQ